jgi:hypothetical protein
MDGQRPEAIDDAATKLDAIFEIVTAGDAPALDDLEAAALRDPLNMARRYSAIVDMLTGRAAPVANADDELEAAWGIIANAGGGDWTTQSAEWRDAATRWRDRVMPGLSARAAERARCNNVAT